MPKFQDPGIHGVLGVLIVVPFRKKQYNQIAGDLELS